MSVENPFTVSLRTTVPRLRRRYGQTVTYSHPLLEVGPTARAHYRWLRIHRDCDPETARDATHGYLSRESADPLPRTFRVLL